MYICMHVYVHIHIYFTNVVCTHVLGVHVYASAGGFMNSHVSESAAEPPHPRIVQGAFASTTVKARFDRRFQ